jgi:glycosyltransferase involved in cell wall biosynthesis
MPAKIQASPEAASMRGLKAFGPIATAWAKQCPAHLPAIIADHVGVAHGMQEAVERKRAGSPFFVVPAIEDTRAIIARILGAKVLRNERDFDRRYDLFSALASTDGLSYGGRTFTNDFGLINRRSAISLRDFMRLGSALLVRSWTEYQRIVANVHGPAGVWGEAPQRSTRALYPKPQVPRWKAGFGGKHLVIWAPDSEPADVAFVSFGVENLHYTTYVVCRNPHRAQEFGLRATFVGLDEAATVLRDAVAIIAADISDPSPAVALAASGVPLAIASTSGAHEYIDGAAMFFPWDVRSVREAALVAFGSGPPRLRADATVEMDYAAELVATQPPPTPNPPLVSIVVSTKNRRHLLPRALDSIAQQTYPNIEILVINDGGEPIADIVARYPNAKLTEHADSKGLLTRLREGTAAVSGKYCVAHSDDDYFFPDHFARCVYALERSGSVAARALLIVSFNEPGKDGRYHITGHTVHDLYAYDPTELMWGNNIGVVVQTRESILSGGLWTSDVGQAADWDCFLKLATLSDLPCIYAVTVNFDQRTDQTNYNNRGVAAWEEDVLHLYAKYPAHNRPLVEKMRLEVLARARYNDMSKVQPMLAATPLDPPVPGDYDVFK